MMNAQYLERPIPAGIGELHRSLSAQNLAGCLSTGLTRLRKALIERANDDVEREFGKDSMVVSSLAEIERQARRAATEIDAYCCVLVNEEVTNNNYLEANDESFLDWLLNLRFAEQWEKVKRQRVDYYVSETVEQRRMKFVSLLQRNLPESVRAPLVLFRLFPRSVRIAAAMAFRDLHRAQELREEQIRLLPAVSYCHECHGRVMECDDSCRCCGNPVWSITWLQSD